MLLALITALALADACGRDTSSEHHATLAQAIHIGALHIDAGGGNVPVNGALVSTTDSHIAIGFCDFPSYTIAWGAAVNVEPATTSYTVAETNGYRPELYVMSTGWEIRRSWRDRSIFRPIVSIGAGTIRAAYHYTLITPEGVLSDSAEREATTTYYAPSVGVEASLFEYVSLYGSVGTRYAGEMNLPGLRAHAFSGPFVTLGMGFGKFW